MSATLSPSDKTKVDKYLLTVAKLSLDLVDKLIIALPGPQRILIEIAGPFRKAVDTRLFPLYPQIISDPMDLGKMRKRVDGFRSMILNANKALSVPEDAGGPGAQFICAILKDMDLLRTNAHTFNADESSADVRFMADYLRNFLRHCLRVFLKLLQQISAHNDCREKYEAYLFRQREIAELLREEPSEDTRAYLHYPETKNRLQDAIEKNNLVSIILGANKFPADLRKAMASLCEVRPPSKKSFFSAPVAAEPAPVSVSVSVPVKKEKASSSSSSAPAVRETTAARETSAGAVSVKKEKETGKRKAEEISPSLSVSVSVSEKEKEKESSTKSTAHSKKKARTSTGAAAVVVKSEAAEEDEIDRWADEAEAVAQTHAQPETHTQTHTQKKSGKRAASTAVTPSATSSSSRKSTAAVPAQTLPQTHAPLPPVLPPTYTLPHTGGPPEWHRGAEEVLRSLCKHPYVSTLSALIAADFLHPVVDMLQPAARAEYLSLVAEPMDISTLRTLTFDTFALTTAEEFYAKLRSIFENAILFNSRAAEKVSDNPTLSDYYRQLIEKSSYLLDFVRWLCLEKLPLSPENDTPQETHAHTATRGSTASSSSLPHTHRLTESERARARTERESILSPCLFQDFAPITGATEFNRIVGSNPHKDCKSVALELTRCKSKKDEEAVAHFCYPVDLTIVPDYAVFIRNPMDLSTLVYKLDRTLPYNSKLAALIDRNATQYESYGEFIRDLRRVFSNAIRFNKAHLESDTTGTSRFIHDLALSIQERLESQIIPKHTLTIADKLSVARYLLGERERERERERKKMLEEKKQEEEILRKIIEEKKATDEQFAVDINPELKRQRTEMELKEREREAQKKILSAGALSGSLSPLLDEGSSPANTPDDMQHTSLSLHGGAHTQGQGQAAPRLPLVFGFGPAGTVPRRWQSSVREKYSLSQTAWSLWAPIRSGFGVAKKSQSAEEAQRAREREREKERERQKAAKAAANAASAAAKAVSSSSEAQAAITVAPDAAASNEVPEASVTAETTHSHTTEGEQNDAVKKTTDIVTETDREKENVHEEALNTNVRVAFSLSLPKAKKTLNGKPLKKIFAPRISCFTESEEAEDNHDHNRNHRMDVA